MSGENGVSPRQKKAMVAILEQPSISKASIVAGVSERQLYRWLQEPVFKAELHQLEGEIARKLARRLLVLGDKAVGALDSLLENPSQPGGYIRRLVAVSILEQLVKYREVADFEERLLMLERKVLENGKFRR